MATASRRRARRSSIDIWPGFVDALAQLVMVIIFVLLVFTVGQFYLSDALTGREQALKQLQQQMNDLTDMLSLERLSNQDLRAGSAQLADRLKGAQVERDMMTTRIAELGARLKDETARADQATGQLRDANTVIAADKEKVALQLKEIESIRRDIEALRSVRAALEARVAALAAEGQAATKDAIATREQNRLLQDQLTAAASDRAATQQEGAALRDRNVQIEQRLAVLTDAQDRAQKDAGALQEKVKALEARIAALTKSQDQASQQAQAQLGALRDRSKELEARLATEQERTLLAQKDVAARDIRLSELGAQAAQTGQALSSEKTISTAALSQVEQLNQQITALREQLQKISAALDISEAEVKNQQGAILDLGKRLNVALASKVEELARYRSEFFGRLRNIIGNRPDVRIVGDRFVFQSEVLFGQGSADLGDEAKRQLDPVLSALKEIAAQIPPEINWILRVDGHTDARPINNAQFKSNWELSAARAISVVRYAVETGLPADHVAAAGFADNQPLDKAANDDSYRRNRRIELKLTER